MMCSNKGERNDDHKDSGEDTPCTNIAADNDTAPRVQACGKHRYLCADDRRRILLLYDPLLVILRITPSCPTITYETRS